MRRLILTAALFAAAPAMAQTRMTGAEFEAYSTGKTVFFSSNGTPYGAEQYLPDRRVIWSFLDGICITGEWYEAGDQICFIYENQNNGPQCWSFFRTDGGISAQFENDPDARSLIELQQSPEPLFCPGPGVGA